jgi:hypothetical protein
MAETMPFHLELAPGLWAAEKHGRTRRIAE